LRNSGRSALLVGALLYPGLAPAAPPDADLNCVEGVLGRDSLVRIDQGNKRLFVVMKKTGQAGLPRLIGRLEFCFRDHPWSRLWSMSVFSSTHVAGYKDESAILPFHKTNAWAEGYLAEYQSAIRLLTLNPATSPRTVAVPPLPQPGHGNALGSPDESGEGVRP
jgi:hypothetical protein